MPTVNQVWVRILFCILYNWITIQAREFPPEKYHTLEITLRLYCHITSQLIANVSGIFAKAMYFSCCRFSLHIPLAYSMLWCSFFLLMRRGRTLWCLFSFLMGRGRTLWCPFSFLTGRGRTLWCSFSFLMGKGRRTLWCSFYFYWEAGGPYGVHFIFNGKWEDLLVFILFF